MSKMQGATAINCRVRTLPINGVRFVIDCRCGMVLPADLTAAERRRVGCDCGRSYSIQYENSSCWDVSYCGLRPGLTECVHCGYVVKAKALPKDCPSCGRRQP